MEITTLVVAASTFQEETPPVVAVEIPVVVADPVAVANPAVVAAVAAKAVARAVEEEAAAAGKL